MAKKTKKPKAAHCKKTTRADGTKRKICFDGKGKITSAAKVKAIRAR